MRKGRDMWNCGRRGCDVKLRKLEKRPYNQFCKRESEGGRSFTVSTSPLWNTLPLDIRMKPSIKCFKKAMLDFFKNSYKQLEHFIL